MDDLIEVLVDNPDLFGIGLSAVQIGIPKRVFVALIRKKWKGFVNPKITKFSKENKDFMEGCLSLPDLYGHVIRPSEIELEALDRMGKKFIGKYKGVESRIIQHEIDHLDGKLFIDHVHAQNGQIYKLKGTDKKTGKEILEEVTVE